MGDQLERSWRSAAWVVIALAACPGCGGRAAGGDVELEVRGETDAIRVEHVRFADASRATLLADITPLEAPIHRLEYRLQRGDEVLVSSFYGPAPFRDVGRRRTLELPPPTRYIARGGVERHPDVPRTDRLVLEVIRLAPTPELAGEGRQVQDADVECRLGDALKCRELAERFGDGPLALRPDAALHRRYRETFARELRKRCDAGGSPADGDDDACFVLGVELTRGEMMEADVAAGETLIARACRAGHPLACNVQKEMQKEPAR